MKMRMSRGNLIFIKIKVFYQFLFKINILYTGLKIRKKSLSRLLFYAVKNIGMFGNALSNDETILTGISRIRPVDSLPSWQTLSCWNYKKGSTGLVFPTNPCSVNPIFIWPRVISCLKLGNIWLNTWRIECITVPFGILPSTNHAGKISRSNSLHIQTRIWCRLFLSFASFLGRFFIFCFRILLRACIRSFLIIRLTIK